MGVVLGGLADGEDVDAGLGQFGGRPQTGSSGL